MIEETLYVAVNSKDEVQWVKGSSSKTRYFKTSKYLSKEIKYHNNYYPDDEWRMVECKLVALPDPKCERFNGLSRRGK